MLKISMNTGKELLFELSLEEFCFKIANKIGLRCIGESTEIKIKPNSVSNITIIKD